MLLNLFVVYFLLLKVSIPLELGNVLPPDLPYPSNPSLAPVSLAPALPPVNELVVENDAGCAMCSMSENASLLFVLEFSLLLSYALAVAVIVVVMIMMLFFIRIKMYKKSTVNLEVTPHPSQLYLSHKSSPIVGFF